MNLKEKEQELVSDAKDVGRKVKNIAGNLTGYRPIRKIRKMLRSKSR